MVVLGFQVPYFSDMLNDKIIIANIEMDDIKDFQVADTIDIKSIAKKGIKYQDREEFIKFASFLYAKDLNHTISSDIAVHKGDLIIFNPNTIYKNSDNLTYKTKEIIYNMKTKIAISNYPFIATKDRDRVIGKSLVYDLNKKTTLAREVKGWFYIEDQNQTN